VEFIAAYRAEFGVEPICTVLSEHGCPIAPSTFYAAQHQIPSARERRDAELIEVMIAERARSRFVARLGARKLWLHLRSRGHDVARCTVERLMRQMGWVGALRGKQPRTTTPGVDHDRPTDRVDRQFTAAGPNRLWVADFTSVPTWAGMVYAAFVFDVFSRRILGWRVATTMTTALVLDCLEMALWTRHQEGMLALTGLVRHNDAGSQYTSIAFTQRLLDEGIDASVGSVGDAYDNAMAESHIGCYKTELINPDGPWRDAGQVELATLEWVWWFNHERSHEGIDDLTPVQAEQVHALVLAHRADPSPATELVSP
jgi:putative transposase